MNPDVLGRWYGREYSNGLTYAQAISGEGWGGPPERYDVTLTVTAQDKYRNFGGGVWVSAFSGELSRRAQGYYLGLIPVSGFVSSAGRVKLGFFTGTPEVYWSFNGTLAITPDYREIAGTWLSVTWSNGILLHGLGELRVHQLRYMVYGSYKPWIY